MFKKMMEKDISYFKKIASKKQLKPLWVVSKMYEKWGARIVSEREVIKLISLMIGVEGKKIKWFIEEVLDKKK